MSRKKDNRSSEMVPPSGVISLKIVGDEDEKHLVSTPFHRCMLLARQYVFNINFDVSELHALFAFNKYFVVYQVCTL